MEYTVISCTKEQLPELETILQGLGIKSDEEWNDRQRKLVELSELGYKSGGVWIQHQDGIYAIHSHPCWNLPSPTRYTFEELKNKHT